MRACVGVGGGGMGREKSNNFRSAVRCCSCLRMSVISHLQTSAMTVTAAGDDCRSLSDRTGRETTGEGGRGRIRKT